MAEHYLSTPHLSTPPPRRRTGLFVTIGILIAILVFSRTLAGTLIEYEWWKEMHQLDTWLNLLLYGTLPVALAALLFWVLFFGAFWLGMRETYDRPILGVVSRSLALRLGGLGFLLLGLLAANAVVDNWTVVRFFGGLRLPAASTGYVDPIFRQPLSFYFFGLPFYRLLLNVLLVAALGSLLIYWLASNVQNLGGRLPNLSSDGLHFDLETPQLRPLLQGSFARWALAVTLAGFGMHILLGRYGLLLDDHGAFLVGVDWVAEHVILPLQWLTIGGFFLAALLVLIRRARWALVLLLLLPVRYLLPPILTALYVRPNELALERPYIQHHVDATRAAYGLSSRVKETSLAATPEMPIDYDKHKATLSNVRLWDWRAFHDTISQIQPLRPYVYYDTDVDRYQIGKELRQVLLAARELDTRQLGEAATHWINPHLMYTHGYGLVMAEANRITPDGLPLLFVQNAPPEVTARDLKFTTPDIYYGEIAHEPVYVNTSQQEFDYPSGSESVYTHYSGSGGFPVDSPLVRLAAAVTYGDLNVLLTSYLNNHSRMMIHRPIVDRVSMLAGFLKWDSDPYIVLAPDGKLLWIMDGYMTSDAHPYSREVDFAGGGANYIRNSVKATVDAYTGEVHLYVFDPNDLLIRAYARLFPNLFQPLSAMPAGIRAHARYPEALFTAQAQIYRTFHMRDPEAFYNRADLWDLAHTSTRQGDSGAADVSPTYVVASLPDENSPEFLLIIPFTPANKDNLIGFMAARCDGAHLGELVFEQLSKQNIVFGPMQIDARINQDQTISKDLTLWNQQGSQVLRGQTLVLPIDNSFLYVAPIYIQASQASMPQLKKVAVAMGNRLAYADTYEEALTQLIAELGGAPPSNQAQPGGGAAPPANVGTRTEAPVTMNNAMGNPSPEATRKLTEIRDHLTRYRELSSQGKWAEAGKELDAIQSLVQK